MSGAITLSFPPPPAVPSFRSRTSTRRMSFRCLSTCHAPPLVEIDSPPSRGARGPPASLYEVLRVKHTATPTEIKTAYRSLAKLYHPDAMSRPESDGQDFIEIHNAYSTLSDPGARAIYDLSLGQMYRRSGSGRRTGFYATRRWETDQCW